jgi:hypothetical protein
MRLIENFDYEAPNSQARQILAANIEIAQIRFKQSD